ncbi:MAG TPA: C13 family peptidase, partial [Cellvibrionaceae bacterium]
MTVNTLFAGALVIVLLCACSSGPTTVRLPDGAEYRGQLHQGLLHNHGEITWPNGDHYQGEFYQGVMQGQGVLTLADGDSYHGHFSNGELQGPGYFTGIDGSYYQGGFEAGVFHGLGEHRDGVGNRYLGYFENGSLHGLGVFQSVDGTHFLGAFSNGKYHGYGVYSDDKGVYSGQFSHGYFHGEGEFVYTDKVKKTETGIWRWGRFRGDADSKAKALAEALAAEKTLYGQQPLLDKQRQQLQKGDPDKIELFLLTLAGDGSERVFIREINTIREVMTDGWVMPGHTLALSNHPLSFNELPLATLTGLQQALETLAEKMDVEQDIAFIYLTSHGSEDHQLSLTVPGLGVMNLPASHLAAFINKLPIKWKVIVVSSCYSGGFMPGLESPSHLVMSAARHDRTSFGCSDDSDMTYFGRAFFNEALPEASSFEDAFERARVVVGQWEEEESLPAS